MLKRSINFALLLSFKKLIIDFIIQSWTLEELKITLPFLHPMECVYMLIYSLSLSEEEKQLRCWFDKEQIAKAYEIFEYIVRWINWKVSDNGDAFYYETYFHDYDRNERYFDTLH
jgi:hypothetical protein